MIISYFLVSANESHPLLKTLILTNSSILFKLSSSMHSIDQSMDEL